MIERLGAPLAEPIFEELAIIGVGLIGSSIARAARHRHAARRIVLADSIHCGFGAREGAGAWRRRHRRSGSRREPRRLRHSLRASRRQRGDRTRHRAGASSKARSYRTSVRSRAPSSRRLKPALPAHARLVPAHPVAGTEYSGPDAGFASLFVNRWCILTPPEGTDEEAVEKMRAFWQTLGSHVETMSAAHHDLVLAITSHVPHLIAYNIVGTAADLEEVTRSEVIKFSAGGFRDFTRIASSDPTMWRDVFLHNKEAVLEMLGRFNEDLTALQRMIRREDGDGLFALFTRTRAIRLGIVAQGQETAAPDFGRRAAETDEPVP